MKTLVLEKAGLRLPLTKVFAINSDNVASVLILEDIRCQRKKALLQRKKHLTITGP